MTRNEPTEPLKNMKKALHPRIVPSAPVIYHDPKYGGWVDPFEFRIKPKKKKKKFSRRDLITLSFLKEFQD